jgi:hypothetical protein
MSKKPSAEAFLAAMQGGQQEAEDQPVKARPTIVSAPPPVITKQDVAELPKPARESSRAASKAKPGRAQLKHFGGYLDDDTLEKIALLRVRLKKDNSELIKFAIDELHKKHNAKRAFGDV